MITKISVDLSHKLENMAFVCALLVVWRHVMRTHPFLSGSWFVFEVVECGVAQIAVPFFFIASGFFLCGSLMARGKGYRQAVRKRIQTLVIPFFLWNILFWWECLLMRLNTGYGCSDLFTSEVILRAFGFYPFDAPFLEVTWYMRSLFILVLLSPLLVRYLKVFKVTGLVIAYLLCSGLYVLSKWNEPISMMLCRRFFSVQGLAFFMVGMYFRLYPISFKPSKRLILYLFFAGMELCAFRMIFRSRIPFQGSTVLIIPLFLVSVWSLMPQSAGPTWLVASSFGLYLVHKFIVVVLQEIASGFLQTWYGFLSGYGIIVIVSIVIVVGLKSFFPAAAKVLLGGR